VILFVGDGMGVSTVTAASIFEGQQRGEPGEENLLAFEELPHLALVKTYNTNQQVPDSAGTMNALVSGVKTKALALGVDERVRISDHKSLAEARVPTILEQAEERGMSTGVVSTARITHATPAACFAHSPNRNWEADIAMTAAARRDDFPDIARQLIEFSFGDGLEVALGGGRSVFLPNSEADPEDTTEKGRRADGRNLTAEWVTRRPRSAYVWRQEEFDAVDPNAVDHLLGLFEYSHMEWEADRGRDLAGEPSLTQMTEKALDVLSRNPKGYFLMVEAGRIDHGHHATNAYRALADTVEFSNAIRAALERVDLEDTLVIVTADHSHSFTMSGYPARGNDILGLVRGNDPNGRALEQPTLDQLKRPYTTLGYANGPGYTGATAALDEGPKQFPPRTNGMQGISRGRPDLSKVDTTDPNYMQETTTPLFFETHSGEDVAVYAGGAGSALVSGVQEQSFVYHVMVEALGWNRQAQADASSRARTAGAR